MGTYTNLTDEEKKLQQQKTPEQQVTAAPAADYSGNDTAPKASYSFYDPTKDAAYMQAMSMLDEAKKGKPTYENTYGAQLNDLYEQIVGRDKFTYDVNADALYQQYRDLYDAQGAMAMRDTMGQAAALTGGYGSSYGQSVGQQQYNAYLQQLNNVVPELYGMAYQRYQDEGDALMNQYGMMGQLADDEYGKYQDALSEYWQNISYLTGQADDAYNRGLQDAQMSYQQKQDTYDQLVDLMTNIGYRPSEEELSAAGMSEGQMQAYLNYYAKMNPVKSSGSGGGGGGSSKKKSTYELLLEEAKAQIDAADSSSAKLAITTDFNSQVAQAYAQGTGALTKEESRKIMSEVQKYASKK